MDKLRTIDKIKEIYIRGGNMMEFLRNESTGKNDIESIMISYDFQAGSYIKMVTENPDYINSYVLAVFNELKNLIPYNSILEIGVGEATLMSPLMQQLDPENKMLKFGFDISWSRIRYGKSHAAKFNQNLTLFTSNLFNIPFPDSSIDIVYTSHSIEPNGGFEKKALMELYRIAKNYIVLLEPDYENGSQQAKERMEKHGYVKNLAQNAKELGYEVIMDRSFEVFFNSLNPTRLTIIKKNSVNSNNPEFICPISKTRLVKLNGNWYSKEAGLLYPEIDGVPCLIEQQAILATKYLNFNAR